MSSFFGKLRANATGKDPVTGFSTSKKDSNQSQQTPLEKLLQDAGPVRNDGSDKFYGMENFGNTCYCNSILQCLYYSVPFREQVINYPRRSPLDSLNLAPGSIHKTNTTTPVAGQNTLSPLKPKTPTGPTSARNPGVPVAPQKPEDKESPEYKKKQAMLTGPILPMNYDNAASYDMTESLFTSLKDIFEAIIANTSRTGVVSPAKFLEVLRKENEMFRTSMHQDAHEFLNLLLNEVVANVEANSKKLEAGKGMNGFISNGGLHNALTDSMPKKIEAKTPSNTGWVHELFEGTLTSETKCLTCENVSQRDEAFLDLSVDLDQHSSVTSCLRKFSEEEMLCERNKFHCDKCGGLQEAEKRMKIKRLPKILALHLKRFKYTEDLQRLQKLFHRVVYPYHLRLFNTTDDAEDPDRLYELYAVVVHIGGGPYHGHYVSIVKTQDRGWILFDDEMVEPVDKSYVRNFFGERPGLACAYVLFYQETTFEAVKREQEAEGLAAAAEGISVHSKKETPILGVKTNGIAINGALHFSAPLSPTSPQSPGVDQYESANRSVNLPPLSPARQTGRPQVSPLLASPITPGLSSEKNDVQSKKERRATEKEQERADARRRAVEFDSKGSEKQQAADIKAAIEASKLSKDQEDKKTTGIHAIAGATTESHNGVPTPAETPTATPTGALSRFRHTSKSTSKKHKFWGLKDSKDSKDETAIEDGEAGTEAGPTPTTERKTRFSGLRKKTSAMLL